MAESAGLARIPVRRFLRSSGAVSVDFKLVTCPADGVDDLATVNADVVDVSGTLSWADGERDTRFIELAIVDDGIAEPTERICVELSNVQGNALIESTRTEVLIADDDTRSTQGRFRLAHPIQAASESAGVLEFQVVREFGDAGVAKVKFETFDASAIADVDYEVTKGELTWADGETGLYQLFDLFVFMLEQGEGS